MAIYQKAYNEGSNEFLHDSLTVDRPTRANKVMNAVKSFVDDAIEGFVTNWEKKIIDKLLTT